MPKNNSNISFSVVGKDIPIKDALEKVTGSIKYGVDWRVADMVYAKILRSPHAHANIKRIDYARAEALPGVLGVVCYQDAPKRDWNSCWHNYRGHIFDDKVRFVGDEVAAVAAVNEEIAEQALELIEVDYDILPAVFDPEEALASDAPQVRSEGNAREPYVTGWGDIDAGIGKSDIVLEQSINFGSQQYAPIGRNACVAEWTGDKVTMWTSTQTPSECKSAIAEAFGISINKVRVIALPSGCSFGIWWINNFHMITVLLAKKIQRPVKIELTQEECFASVKRRHLERSWGRIGCSQDGEIHAIEIKHIFDNGGYGFKDDVGSFSNELWGRCRNGHFTVQGVSTNLVTAGCMRGVGDVTEAALIERLLDMAAEKLNLDPLKFRLKHHVRTGDLLKAIHADYSAEGPFCNTPAASENRCPRLFHLTSEALHECLLRGAEAFDWANKWKGWLKPFRVLGPKRRAVGVGTGIHCNGVEEEGNTAAIVRIHEDGSATLCCSMGRHGQGSETTQAQIAAETLGISPDLIEVEAGDTEVSPWNHGSIASNTTHRIGYQTKAACEDARNQILEIAARHYLNGASKHMRIKDGIIYHVDKPDQNISIRDLMSRLQPDSHTPPRIIGRPVADMPPTLTLTRHFAAHFVEVEVDTDTGQIRLLDYVATQDSGTVINPKALENQVIGGAIAGSGFGLVESLVFDERTGKILNPNFLDYKVLRTTDFPLQPRVILCESDDPIGPYGAKGAGEAPIAAPIPAIAQAVYNAIGVWLDVPMTPDRVLKGLGII